MVMSGGSTFSQTAASWGPHRPYVVMGNDQCMQDLGTEPIFHRWLVLQDKPPPCKTREQLMNQHMINHLQMWNIAKHPGQY